MNARYLLAALLLFAPDVRAQEPADTLDGRPPNVVIILADDLGYGDVSAYGGWIGTPHLDRMAREGLRFTSFYASAPACSPTRAGLLTGRYQQRAGLPGVIYAARDQNRHHGLQLEEITLAELAKEAGYATGVFGKWHLGYEEQYNPVHQGFDAFRGYVDYFSHIDGIGVHDWWDGAEKVREEGYVTHLVTEHAVDFIERHQDEPFFLYVAHEAPHFPYQGPDDEAFRVEGQQVREDRDSARVRAVYPEMVRAMDDGIGAVLDALERHGLAEHTLVVFFSDNGPKRYGSAGDLRGWKTSVWEGGIRVPAVAWWPGRIEAGRLSDDAVISLDLMPTALGLMGASPPEGHRLDGTDLAPLLFDGRPTNPRTLFWEYQGQQAVREGDWKLVQNAKSWVGDTARAAGPFLFNLREDKAETTDVAADQGGRVQAMLEALEAWQTDVQQDATPQPERAAR